MMTKDLIKKVQVGLKTKKERLEKELSNFAVKDPNLKGDWDSKYPRVPQGNIEEAANEVEEYSTTLPIEFSLETQLRDVNSALEKIKNDSYGVCEKCEKEIDETRLEISPEAKFCQKCKD